MQQMLSQLGIDWRLLISQAIDFFALLFVLRIFLYKPLLKLLRDRQQKIEEGVVKAEMADVRLNEANETSKEKIKAAEAEALAVLRKTERDAKVLEAKLLEKAKEKEAAAMKDMDAALRIKEDESRREVARAAQSLVKAALVKMVALDPSAVDDALIAKAMKEIQ